MKQESQDGLRKVSSNKAATKSFAEDIRRDYVAEHIDNESGDNDGVVILSLSLAVLNDIKEVLKEMGWKDGTQPGVMVEGKSFTQIVGGQHQLERAWNVDRTSDNTVSYKGQEYRFKKTSRVMLASTAIIREGINLSVLFDSNRKKAEPDNSQGLNHMIFLDLP